MDLSAVLIAKDEERDLPAALSSLKGLANEIIVLVDESSGDRTSQFVEAAGAKIFFRKFDDFASQKQAALELANGSWALSLDADERISDELRREIIEKLNAPGDTAAFDIPFQVYFLGRRLRFGSLGAESHVRLFRRQKARFTGAQLHEGVEVQGPVQRLRGAIIHEPYRDLSDYLVKMDSYTTLAAQKRFAQGRRFHCWHHLLLPWEFFVRAVLKLGFLDGCPGLVWAGLSAFHSWLKYVKLKQLEQGEQS
ncbi:MAG: hypothetical protein A3J74_00955 [Elusimicrobia bacterium RIFCSPHIGHO2_02_FULL_57_9]|nr:MAG: hypothetical protein A3J74_00955 [Elusimicrobia bacterium RIFCSPHIGHO2_02_FULL_57_9]